MKQSTVEWLEKELNAIRLDIDKNVLKFIDKSFDQAKEMEKQQIFDAQVDFISEIIPKEEPKQKRMFSEEEVLNFTQTILMQYKFGNKNIEQMDLLKETLEKFKNK